jgi:hypothetical protein
MAAPSASSEAIVASLVDHSNNNTRPNSTAPLPSSPHPHSSGITSNNSIENELFPAKPHQSYPSASAAANSDEFAELLAAFSHQDDGVRTPTNVVGDGHNDDPSIDDAQVLSSTKAATATWETYLEYKESNPDKDVQESLIVMALAGPLTSMRILSSTASEVDISAIGKDAGLDVNRLFKSAILATPPASPSLHDKGIPKRNVGGGGVVGTKSMSANTIFTTPGASKVSGSNAASLLGHINPLHSWLAALPDQSGAIAANNSSVVCTLRRLWTFNEQEVFRMNSDEQLSVSTTTKTVLCHRVFGTNSSQSQSSPTSTLLSKGSYARDSMSILHRVLQNHATIKYLSLRVQLSSSSVPNADVERGMSLSDLEEFVNLWYVSAKAAWEGLTGLQFRRLLRANDEDIEGQPSITLLPLLQTFHLEFEATPHTSNSSSSSEISSRVSKVLSNITMIANWRPNLVQFGARGVQLLPPLARSSVDQVVATCSGNLTTAILLMGGGGGEVDLRRFFLRPASYTRFAIAHGNPNNNNIKSSKINNNNDALTYMWWDYHTGFAPTATSLLLHPPPSSSRNHQHHQPASRAQNSSPKTTTNASQLTYQIIQKMVKWFVSEQLTRTKIHVPEAVPNLLVDRSNRTPWGERRSSTDDLKDAPNKLHPMYGSTLPRTLLVEPCLDGEKATPLLEELWAALPLYGAQPLPDVSSLDFYNMDAAGAVQHVLRAVLSEQLLEYLRTAVRQRTSSPSTTKQATQLHAKSRRHHHRVEVDESDPSARSLFAQLKPLLDEVFASETDLAQLPNTSLHASIAPIAGAAAEFMGGCVMQDTRQTASLNSSFKVLKQPTALPLEEYLFGVISSFGKSSPAFSESVYKKTSLTSSSPANHHLGEAARCLVLDALTRQLSGPVVPPTTTTTTCPPSAQFVKEMRDIQERPRQSSTPTLSLFDELSEFLQRFDTTTPTSDPHYDTAPVIRFGALHAVGIIPTPSNVLMSSTPGTKVLPLPSVLVGRLRELQIVTSRNPMVPSTIQTDTVVWPSTTHTTPIGAGGVPLHPQHPYPHEGDISGQLKRVVSLTGAGDTQHKPLSSLEGASSPQHQHSPRSTSPQRPQETAKAFYVEAPLWC